ncbi:MAG: regulatory protein [Actinomycetota bacterium]|jgi:SOS response regulatory protein OraA/RecX|nr:regulatory protein RecX [Glaciihabitans sp.]MDQ1562322.1 regulatory protein [Actinomycetota bacterium]MDQ1563374.1 regulatory protein [Actinomycetota bacterium]
MTNTSGSGVTQNGERLARVTYLPGVVPPSSTPEPLVLDEHVADEQDRERESDGERSARAHNVSMHALTRKGMSSAEMTVLLKSRDLDEHDVEVEVARLEEVGLLDDHDLANNLVRTLRDRKGLGRSAINAELRRRKIDSVAIEEALSDAYPVDGDDELTRAREIAIKRAPQLRSLDAETARRRLGAFLMRKGYSGSVVASAVATALASNAPTPRGPRFQ